MFRLETPRLILREMRADDANALRKVFSDPLVMASFPGMPPFDTGRMVWTIDEGTASLAQTGAIPTASPVGSPAEAMPR